MPRESIEGLLVERIFDIWGKLPDWCPENALHRVLSETLTWEADNIIMLHGSEDIEAIFRTSAFRYLQQQFKNIEWYLSPISPSNKLRLLIGILNIWQGKRYIILASRVKREPDNAVGQVS